MNFRKYLEGACLKGLEIISKLSNYSPPVRLGERLSFALNRGDSSRSSCGESSDEIEVRNRSFWQGIEAFGKFAEHRAPNHNPRVYCNMDHQGNDIRITLIGAGTIGLSFAAFHLSHLSSPSQLTILDTRPDLEEYVRSTLPKFFPDAPISYITLSNSLPDAVRNASIIQESGPENLPFKKSIWAEVEKYAPQDTLLWSSTSGIPASQQAADMQDKTRLLVVRKLISISPSSTYSQAIQGSSVQSTAHNAITRARTIPTDIR